MSTDTMKPTDETVTVAGVVSSDLLGSGLLTWRQHFDKQFAECGTPTADELIQAEEKAWHMRDEIEQSSRSGLGFTHAMNPDA